MGATASIATGRLTRGIEALPVLAGVTGAQRPGDAVIPPAHQSGAGTQLRPRHSPGAGRQPRGTNTKGPVNLHFVSFCLEGTSETMKTLCEEQARPP